jgi:hypothetical protein
MLAGMNWRRVFLPFLAALLLSAQQGAFAHALSHLADFRPAGQEKHAPHSPACEKCVEYAGVGSALAASSFAIAAPPDGVAAAPRPFASAAGVFLPAYRSRAPPFLA